MQTSWDWREEGFKHPPKQVPSKPGMRLYRAWGGKAGMRGHPSRAGVCFSTDRPSSRMEAEKSFAAFEWGNTCLMLTEFLVPAGTPVWMGEVDPGDPRAILGGDSGVQVFIENPIAQTLIPTNTVPLTNDLRRAIVHTGPSGRA